MAGNRIGGTVLFLIDGTQYALRGKFEYSPLLSIKKGVAGQDGVHGYTEKPTVPYFKGDLSDLGGVSVSNLGTLTASTFTAELANGKVVILSGGWLEGEVSVDTEEGQFSVEFRGTNIIEITD